MISDHVYKLCTSNETVSSVLANDPTTAPGDAWNHLFSSKSPLVNEESKKSAQTHRDEHTPEDLARALECGRWGSSRPSELFLRIYHDALCTLDSNVSGGMVSPPLLGSCGIVPLTILSVIPDIMRHMANMIVRAEHEVILATNYWQNSVASKYITDALRELSRRAGVRGQRIVVKIEYDRGNLKQVVDNHSIVPEKEYTAKEVNMPPASEIPNVDLQVMNFHTPAVGTFHCKYMIVDRKMAMLQSNNIQDNDNVEMAMHLEGPIVDSLYDMALISWSKELTPPLPSHATPATTGDVSTCDEQSFGQSFAASTTTPNIGGPKSYDTPHEAFGYPAKEFNKLGISHPDELGDSEANAAQHYSAHNDLTRQEGQGDEQVPGAELRTGEQVKENARAALTTGDHEHIQYEEPAAQAVPPPNQVQSPGLDNQTALFLNTGTPTLPSGFAKDVASAASSSAAELTTDNAAYDDTLAAEILRVQASVSPSAGRSRVQAVTAHLNHTKNPDFKGSATEDVDISSAFTPYIAHTAHSPVPIAMVCREPYGMPTHGQVYNPQNEAWLSALRNARRNVFIQSPTLNAEPLVPAIVAACERGVDVFCYICLGYNDTGELLPRQGGTNEMIAHKMYTTLSMAGKQHLHYFFYVAKDMTHPVLAKYKKRSCHVKLMLVDERIIIQGNGNQDTQSWYHSQEINTMIESPSVAHEIIGALRRNQNTHLYGEVSKEDGVWRDGEGKEAQGAIGVDPGRWSWAKGFMGAVRRVRGAGDF